MIIKQKNSVWSNIKTVLDKRQKMSQNVNVNFVTFRGGIDIFRVDPPCITKIYHTFFQKHNLIITNNAAV